MIPDLRFPADTWVDLYAATGFPVGTALVLQNKLDQKVLVYIGTVAPAVPPSDGLDGFLLLYGEPARITAGTVGCWAKLPSSAGAQARICVQEATS